MPPFERAVCPTVIAPADAPLPTFYPIKGHPKRLQQNPGLYRGWAWRDYFGRNAGLYRVFYGSKRRIALREGAIRLVTGGLDGFTTMPIAPSRETFASG